MERHPDIPFEAYKEMRRVSNKALKQYLRGTLIWCSVSYSITTETLAVVRKRVSGTYVRSKHGIIGRASLCTSTGC